MKQKTFNRLLVAIVIISGILWGFFISRMLRESVDVIKIYDNYQYRLFLKPEVKVHDIQDLVISGSFLMPTAVPVYQREIVYTSIIEDLIQCESSGNKWAVGKAGECGLLQFMPETFQHFCVRGYGLPNDIWSTETQRECADLMIRDGRLNHWTCGQI